MIMMGCLLYADFRTVLSCRPAGGSNGFHDREKYEVLDRIVCFDDALGSLIRALFQPLQGPDRRVELMETV
jgi:hypothetical protein